MTTQKIHLLLQVISLLGMTNQYFGNTLTKKRKQWCAQSISTWNILQLGTITTLHLLEMRGTSPESSSRVLNLQVVRTLPTAQCLVTPVKTNSCDRHLQIRVYDPYTDSYTRCAGMQSYRHMGKTVVAWLDGHVSTVSTRFNSCDDDEHSGFISEDNNAYDPRTLSLD